MELKLYFLFPFCPPCRLQFNAWVEKRPGHSHRSIKYRPFLVGDDHFRRPRGEVFYRDEIDTFLDIRTEGEGENCRHVISPEHYWVFAQDGCIENMATGGTESHTKRCALVREYLFPGRLLTFDRERRILLAHKPEPGPKQNQTR